MEKYRGYHPIERIVQIYQQYNGVSNHQMVREITDFIVCYLIFYYSDLILESKSLLFAQDKDSQLVGLQLCCRDFLKAYDLINYIDENIFDVIVGELKWVIHIREKQDKILNKV